MLKYITKRSVIMSVYDYCCACTYLGESADYNGKYWCSAKGENRYASDPKCHSFCEAYSRSYSAKENMYDNSKSHAEGGCYITTIMCQILGYPDNNYYLNTLRKFRDNVMRYSYKYITGLITYDLIGPMIAYQISIDKDKEVLARTMFDNYITKAVAAIEEEKYDTAFNIYKAMTEELAARYHYNVNVVKTYPRDIKLDTLGHGRKLKKDY